MNNTKIGILFTCLLLFSCSSNSFKKTPVDELIKNLDTEKNFTIILYDMDVEGGWPDKYKHKYKLIKEKEDGIPYEEVTDWYEVSENTFGYYENDMGMEIASKVDGKVTKETSPPGYSRYVGNDKYGNWRNDSSGNSFWAFYGQYAFMSSMMGLVAGPVYRTGYYDYNNNYRGRRPYYGTATNGRTRYGTLSDASRKQNPSFHRRSTTNSALKSRVSNSISRSAGGRTGRSTSRYGSSSARSRSSSSGGK
jgi:hypothetical protein